MGLRDWIFGPAVAKIEVMEAYSSLQDAKPPLLLDVRQPVETRSQWIPGSVLIPLTELGNRLEELPRDRSILTICRSNHRSPLAARRLTKAGFQVLDVTGGIDAWNLAGLPLERPGSRDGEQD